MRTAESETVPSLAVIFASVSVKTALVVTVKVAVDAPAGTLTEEGVAALGVLEESETLNPPTGADPLRVTVPVADLPPATTEGLTDTEANDAG